MAINISPDIFLATAPVKPGVYRFFSAEGKVIYVGKAKNLKKRLQSYFRKNLDSSKTQLVMSKVVDVQVTVTNSENEALILENNLIKELRPRYNILMRDDKSYPFIVLSNHSQFPRLSAYRGAKKNDQRYFGPYPNSGAVKESLELLQKLFHIRSCTDVFFNNRTRPCLQYQIKRCSAPCVDYISVEQYAEDVEKARLFLTGKNKDLIKALQAQMQQASAALQFERAAALRDQIEKLAVIQEQQDVMQEQGNFDVIVVSRQLEQTGIAILNVHEGKLLGTKTFMLKTHHETLAEILGAFLSQHYLAVDKIPTEVLVNVTPDDKLWLSSVLSEQSQHKVAITVPQRGEKMRWLDLATNNLEQALMTHIQQTLSQKKRWQYFSEALHLTKLPERIECFDISHSHGEATVASCVVFDEQGALKKEYRRFNIHDVTAGDDYGALRQAVMRRYSRLQKNEQCLPDLVLIDGGKGQLQQAINVFAELDIHTVKLISISKGTGRKAEFDTLWDSATLQPIPLASDSIALHLAQQIRDEAHRFAITGHKAQRGKAREHSVLEDIEGVGAKRRRALLKTFGGLQGVQRAAVAELSTVQGISMALAQKIYDQFHLS